MKRMLLVLVLVASLAGMAQAATITVGPTGDYANLVLAWAAANPGDVLEIQTGTYTQTSDPDMMNLSPAVDAYGNGIPVTITSVSGDKDDVVIDGDVTTSSPGPDYFIWMTTYFGQNQYCDITISNITLKQFNLAFDDDWGQNDNFRDVKFDHNWRELIWYLPNSTEPNDLYCYACSSYSTTSLNGNGQGAMLHFHGNWSISGTQCVAEKCYWEDAMAGIYVSGVEGDPNSADGTSLIEDCVFEDVDRPVLVQWRQGEEANSVLFKDCLIDAPNGSILHTPVQIFSSNVWFDNVTIQDYSGDWPTIHVEKDLGATCPDVIGKFHMKASTISNCTISAGNGAGIRVDDDQSLFLETTTIDDCDGANQGGGIYVAAGARWFTAYYCWITNCSASRGGGVYIEEDVSVVDFSHNEVKGNSATSAGAGIYNRKANISFFYNTVCGNEAIGGTLPYGGGMVSENRFSCGWSTFSSNYAEAEGGGIYVHCPGQTYESYYTIYYDNCSDGTEGVDVWTNGGATFHCCDTPNSAPGLYAGGSTGFSSCIYDQDPDYCWTGVGLVCDDTDLPFADGNYRLQKTSPCKNNDPCGNIGAWPAVSHCFAPE